MTTVVKNINCKEKILRVKGITGFCKHCQKVRLNCFKRTLVGGKRELDVPNVVDCHPNIKLFSSNIEKTFCVLFRL